jgi:predicted ATPase
VEGEVEAGEHLSRDGNNIASVAERLYTQHPDIFRKILERLKIWVPGVDNVESKIENGRVFLRIQDGAFKDPFAPQNISDGTLAIFAYLVLLHDPKPHPLLCVEEPENRLYQSLLEILVEELRAYAYRGGQVMVSTHSPDFLNACHLDEVFWLEKHNGYSQVFRAKDDPQIVAYMEDEGDKMGTLWTQGFFGKADPV